MKQLEITMNRNLKMLLPNKSITKNKVRNQVASKKSRQIGLHINIGYYGQHFTGCCGN